MCVITDGGNGDKFGQGIQHDVSIILGLFCGILFTFREIDSPDLMSAVGQVYTYLDE
jgi:hypothetical protein